MVKLLRLVRKDSTKIGYMHWCPACDEHHPIYVEVPDPKSGMRYAFNGDAECPTFTPSLRPTAHCHYLIKNGIIEYLPDSLHPLAGSAVEMPKGDIS